MIPEMLLPLELLPGGHCAEIAEVHGEPSWVGRMAELGLRVGCRLRVLQSGCPCLIDLGGTRLSVRGGNATMILVRPTPAA